MKAGDPARSEAPHASRHGLSAWAIENPMAFAGLWFAAAAGLLSSLALVLLPTLVAEARTYAGWRAWQVGAVALGHLYVSPLLLALVTGSLLGAPIVVPGLPSAWAAAVRGAAVGALSNLAWLMMGAILLQAFSRLAAPGSSEAPSGVEAIVVVILGCGLLAMAVAMGAAAGFLLHALAPRAAAPLAGEHLA